MKPTVALALVLLLVPALWADTPAEKEDVKAAEAAVRALNAAFVKKDLKAIEALTTKEHIAITPYCGGVADRETELKSLPDLVLTEYTEADIAFKSIAPGVVRATYRASLVGKFKGKPVPKDVVVLSIWVKQDGKWVQATYQETAVTKVD